MLDFLKKKKGIFGGNSSSASTSDLSISQKADILAMREDGVKPSDIAEELGIAADKVSKVIEHEKRRMATLQGANATGNDRLKEIEIQIKETELEMKLQEKQWALDDRAAERADFLRGIPGGDEEDAGFGGVIEKLLMTALISKFGGVLQPNKPNIPQTFETGAGAAAQAGAPQAPPTLSEEQIKDYVAQYPKEVKALNKLPDEKIIEILQSKLPDYSDETYQTALAVIKKRG
jgi:hypothetical protein